MNLRAAIEQDQKPEGEGAETGWAVVMNPKAGRRSLVHRDVPNLRQTFQSLLGEDVNFFVTSREADVASAVRAAIARRVGTIVAVGGDGTANGLLNTLLHERQHGRHRPSQSDISMALVPTGTRNVLAQSLHIPGDISPAIIRAKSSPPRPMDVIRVTASKGKGSRADGEPPNPTVTTFCLNAAEIGVGASMGRVSKKLRKVVRIRPIATAASAIATVPAYTSDACMITLEGGKSKKMVNMTMCVVANCRMIGGGIEAAPHADPADGLLDVMVLTNAGSLKLLYEIVKLKSSADAAKEKDVFYSQARKVSLNPVDPSREIPVTVDGEPAGFLPATFEILPREILFRR